MTSLILDNSAFARIRTEPTVAASVRAYATASLGGLRSVLVQRAEICISARNLANYDAMVTSLAAVPLLDSDTADVRAAVVSLQRSLVQAGTHRGPKVIDLLIAATALVHDATVLHYDSDFDTLVAADAALKAHWVVPRGSI
ncbi:hypothetical protein SAMN05444157_0768 [Frankineae bacterium MT45]|nr:hypothetical protein SAMN05444157_0768 [Frankineae bacterium MT45]